jgi:integrase
MGRSGDIAATGLSSSIDPVTEHAVCFKDCNPASRRFIQCTWRALVKACAHVGVAPCPLTDAAVEAVVRQWLKRGVSSSTLQNHRWALERLQEASSPGSELATLSAARWARLVWSASPARRVVRPVPTITVYETGLLVERLGTDWESQRLRILLQLLDKTGASLPVLLHVKQSDVVGNSITFHLRRGPHTVDLGVDTVEALLPWLDHVDPQAFLFSNDAGVTPLPVRAVSAMLCRSALEVLSHPITWRAVRNASIRFQLRLGISAQSLAIQCGMGVQALLRAADMPLSQFEYGLMQQHGTSVISDWPLFTHVYQAMRSAGEEFSGVRDRAIFSLLYFAFATPATISAMNRSDFAEGMYCLEREHGWRAFGSQERVVAALTEWMVVRGEYQGPLFVCAEKGKGAQRVTPAQIETMVRQRSRLQRRCFTASAVRLAGITRAADAGLPLAELADASDLAYEQLAGVLGLHQNAETIARVKLQIDALLKARIDPNRFEHIRDKLPNRDYIHAGTP